MKTTPKRTPRETWEALERRAREEEIDRHLAMPIAEVEARLRASGHDPETLRKEGLALVESLRTPLRAAPRPPPRDAQ